MPRRTPPATEPAQSTVEVQRDAMLTEHRTAVATALATDMASRSHGASAIRTVLSQLELPAVNTAILWDVTVTIPGVCAPTAEAAQRSVMGHMPNRIYSDDDSTVSSPVASGATRVGGEPDPPAPAVPSTTLGRQAGAEAIREWDREFYSLAMSRYGQFGDRIHTWGVEVPQPDTFTVMVPLNVTAFTEAGAAEIASNAVRRSFRSPSLGQTDYVTVGTPIIAAPEGSDSGVSQPVPPVESTD